MTPAQARRQLTSPQGDGLPGESTKALRTRYAAAAPQVQEMLLRMALEGVMPARDRARLGMQLLNHQAKIEDDGRKLLDSPGARSLFDAAEGTADVVPKTEEEIDSMTRELERLRAARTTDFQALKKKAKGDRAHLRLVASNEEPEEEDAA